MKAYHVFDNDRDTGMDEIVFAESSGKAKIKAEVSSWVDFVEVRALRKPQFDKYAEQGFVPKSALLADGWSFECHNCCKTTDSDRGAVIIDGHVHCETCAKLKLEVTK